MSFPGTGTLAPNEEIVTQVWLAESLADLGRLIRSRKSVAMPLPFFFDAVDEGWSAMIRVPRDLIVTFDKSGDQAQYHYPKFTQNSNATADSLSCALLRSETKTPFDSDLLN